MRFTWTELGATRADHLQTAYRDIAGLLAFFSFVFFRFELTRYAYFVVQVIAEFHHLAAQPVGRNRPHMRISLPSFGNLKLCLQFARKSLGNRRMMEIWCYLKIK